MSQQYLPVLTWSAARMIQFGCPIPNLLAPETTISTSTGSVSLKDLKVNSLRTEKTFETMDRRH